MLGLTQYFYDGGRFLYPALLAGWLLIGALLWRPRLTRTHLHGLLLTLIAAVIVAAPIYYTLLATDMPVSVRLARHRTSLGMQYWQTVLEDSYMLDRHINWKLLPSFLVYVHMAEGSFFYRGQTPLVLTAAVPFLLLGAGVALWRFRQPAALLLALWVIGTSLANNLLVDSLAATRYVIAFPALALLIAWGLRAAPELPLPADIPGRDRLIRTVGLLGGVALMVVGAHYYFNVHLPLYNFQFRDNEDARDGQDAVLRSLTFPPDTQLHIIGNPPPDESYTGGFLRYLTDDYNLDTLPPWHLRIEYLVGLEKGVDHAFYLEPDDAESLALLREYFVLEAPQTSPFDLPPQHQYVLYYAPYVPGISDELRAKLPTPFMLEGNR
jgi:hypothetical protein